MNKIRAINTIAVAVFILLQLSQWRVHDLYPVHDTLGYEITAGYAWDSRAFWTGRAFFLPLVIKLLNHTSAVSIHEFQVLASLSAWLVLAFAMMRVLRVPVVRSLAAITTLVLGACEAVSLWNHIYSTESLSISLCVIYLAAWILYVDKRTWGRVCVVLATGFLFASVRDSNAYVVLGVGALVLAWLPIRAAPRRMITLIFLTHLFTFLCINYMANEGLRWGTVRNVLQMRLFPVSKYSEWFHANGFPSDVDMRKVSHMAAGSEEWETLTTEAPDVVETYNTWVNKHGKRTYLKFLLSHPGYAVSFPLRQYRPLFFPRRESLMRGTRVHDRSWSPITTMIFSRPWFMLVMTMVVAILFVIIGYKRVARNSFLFTGLALVGLSVLHGMLVSHGDVIETSRHALGAAIQMRLGFGVLLLGALDLAIHRRQKKRPMSACVQGL